MASLSKETLFDSSTSPFDTKEAYNSSLIKSGEESISTGSRHFFEVNPKGYWYVFSGKVVSTTPWDSIRVKNLYLKRYDLDVKTLDSLNWRIVHK